MPPSISLSCGEYGITHPLLDGTVGVDGVEVTPVATSVSPRERFVRMTRDREFDVCELSLGSYLSSRADPEAYPFTAIPVFPDRAFRHGYVLRHDGADVDDPGDFAGKAVGLTSWQATAGVWMRGIAAEHYGLDLERVRWVVDSGMPVDVEVPEAFDVEPSPAGTDTHEMLLAGELDGLMSPGVPDLQEEAIEQVFDDPVAEERAYFRETGVFPVQHTVVVRDEMLTEHPWLGPNLYRAFVEARDVGLERFDDPDRSPLAWSFQYQLAEDAFFEETPWRHGLTDGNRQALAALLRYCHRLGLVPERYDVASLFAPATVDRDYLGH